MRRNAFVASLLAGLVLAALPADAQETGSNKIAVVNPARVFAEMQETKDLRAKLEQQRATIEAELKARQAKVKDLQAARDLLKNDSPQYQEADKAFMKEAIEFDTWSKITQAQLQGEQKQQMKTLFDKIVSATQEVATAQAIDLVLADQRPDLPENLGQISVDQLRTILNQRNVLHASEKVDLTDEVIAKVDEKYRAGGGAASGASAPAPAPAPAPAQ